MKIIKQIVDEYFQQHPEAKDEVIKAAYAYGGPYPHTHIHRWPREPEIGWEKNYTLTDPFQHLRHDSCMACGRTRFEVRYGNISPKCSGWKLYDIKNILLAEEENYFKMLDNSKPIIDKIIKQRGLSGETLAFLHHTHGIDIEIVEAHIELTNEMRKDYLIAWEQHCATGGEFK